MPSLLLMVQKSGKPVEVGGISRVLQGLFYIPGGARISSINCIIVHSKFSTTLWQTNMAMIPGKSLKCNVLHGSFSNHGYHCLPESKTRRHIRPRWNLLSDPTKKRTTSNCTLRACARKVFVLYASCKKWTISRCSFWAAMNRGVPPSFVRPWSTLAPDWTRNWTTSRCPFWAAM